MTLFSNIVVLLLLLPATAAILVACLGQGNDRLVRQVGLAATLLSAFLSLVLAYGFLTERSVAAAETFAPAFVPGSPSPTVSTTTWNLIDLNMGRELKDHRFGAIQFYVGIDGRVLFGSSLTILGDSTDADYGQLAVVVGFAF